MSMSIGSLLGGTAAIEMLFVMPGMGYMVTNAVTRQRLSGHSGVCRLDEL